MVTLWTGCAAPGNPTPPRAGIPKAITDLAAHQQGTAVVLDFTLPKLSVSGDTLDSSPDVDVYRAAAVASGEKPQLQLVLTVPGAATDTYSRAGKMEITDALGAGSVNRSAGLVYSVRTRTSKKHASADSNLALLELMLAPQAPTDLRGNVTESAVELSWLPPSADTAGAALQAALGYRVYRGEIDPVSPPDQSAAQAKLKVPLTLIGSSAENNFRDEHFVFGAKYIYTVRAIIAPQPGQQDQSVESADSVALSLIPRDTFPPAAPTGAVAAIVPATNDAAAYVELSWEPNAESDLAGYWVYRSEDSGTPGQRINAQLLLSPTARDTTVAAGKHYFYRVAAVDQAGNESAAGAAIAVDVPQN